MLTFHVEPYSQAIGEMRSIYPEHYLEIALDQHAIPLDPDYELYLKYEAAGILHVATARNDGDLVGYAIFIVTHHLHYRTSVTAMNDIVYMRKPWRDGLNVGKRFLEFCVASLPENVQRVFINEKLHQPFGRLLEHMGFKLVEQRWSKLLRE